MFSIVLSENGLQFTKDATRQFSGVAHSGKPFELRGERFVVDLETIQPLNSPIGVLIEHNANARAGSGQLRVENHQLWISGSLLDNEHGRAIAQDSDGDFPFEMSAHIQSKRVESLEGNESVVVNGQSINAPIKILKDCVVREVSFVAVGVDQHTHAVVLSKGKDMEKENPDIQELLNKIKALEEENATLKAEKAKEEQKAKVNQKLSQAGFQMNSEGGFHHLSADTYALLLSANEAHLDAVISDLKLGLKNSLPEHFQEEQPESCIQLSISSNATTIGGYQMI